MAAGGSGDRSGAKDGSGDGSGGGSGDGSGDGSPDISGDGSLDGSGDGSLDGSEDSDEAGGDAASGRDPLRFNRWMRSSASGGILTGIALGLQHALEERREQPAFVMEAPGEPEDPDAPITLHFDPDDPTKTVAVIRTPSDDARPDRSHPPTEDA